MRVFILGATGYIGGAIAKRALQVGHTVQGLARSDQAEAMLRERGVVPVRGNLDDHEMLVRVAHESDAVIFAVSYSNDIQAAMRLLLALEVLPKHFSILVVSAHTATPARVRLMRTNRFTLILYSLL